MQTKMQKNVIIPRFWKKSSDSVEHNLISKYHDKFILAQI